MTLPQFLFGAPSMNHAASFLSLPPYKEGVSYTKRVPNCQKCGQHGRKSRLKGHKRVCPFKDCNCPKCQVVSERQKLMADQIKIRRRQRKDTLMNLTREKITATLNAAAAVAAVPVPGFPQLSALYSAAATGSVNNHSAFSQPRASLPTSTLAHMGMSGLDMASFHGHDGRASPMSIHSLATVSSASPQTSTIMSPPSFNLIPSHASSPVLSSTSSTDLTPPHSAGLAAPIPINSMPMNTPISSNGGLLDNQQLLQLLLLCQQGPQQSAGLAQQPASLPQTTLPQPIVSTPTSPTNMIDMQEQLQKLLAMAAMNQTNLGHGAQPVQQLSPPPEDLKKFIGDNIEMVSDKHSSSEGGEDEEANDDVDVV
ncbi:unnamed protein product [Bursaphelenchus xylophilus]|uniref:(pine wood nematode) hypothetical protein n=1 Tax=Bursaphelenchus xylophilus TaxID=6326 RepID=A0A1I7RMS1_BURXY|nr:unnamed protein product [Bursaphelenchus xylophilus]CAG9125530.1 unnamed protein product [Bursaphelenchus xylophilus]